MTQILRLAFDHLDGQLQRTVFIASGAAGAAAAFIAASMATMIAQPASRTVLVMQLFHLAFDYLDGQLQRTVFMNSGATGAAGCITTFMATMVTRSERKRILKRKADQIWTGLNAQQV